jgi:MYXO-CTERM domain-containing protein
MRPSRLTLVLAAIAASASLSFAATDASAWTPLQGPPYPVWPGIPVKYYINNASFPPALAAVAQQRIVDGFNSWSTPSCTFFETELLGDLPGGAWNSNDGRNVLYWISNPEPWPADFGDVNGVIGVTLPIWGFSGGENQDLSDADIAFNNIGFCWYDGVTNPGGNCTGGTPVDALSIITHEQGHFLGLGHTDVQGSTMVPYYVEGPSLGSIEQDDIDGVCALYPTGKGCSSCKSGAVAGACNAAAQGCVGACIGIYNCVKACPTTDAKAYDTCLTACVTQYPDGAQAWSAYNDCICNACVDQCSAECSGTVGTGSGSGGTQASGAWNSDNPDDAEPEGPQINDAGGCGCTTAGTRTQIGTLAALSLSLAALARRRRRRG